MPAYYLCHDLVGSGHGICRLQQEFHSQFRVRPLIVQKEQPSIIMLDDSAIYSGCIVAQRGLFDWLKFPEILKFPIKVRFQNCQLAFYRPHVHRMDGPHVVIQVHHQPFLVLIAGRRKHTCRPEFAEWLTEDDIVFAEDAVHPFHGNRLRIVRFPGYFRQALPLNCS